MADIVVACGSGVATSETVVASIKNFLNEHNVSGVNAEATDFKQLANVISNYDVYVWLAKPTPEIRDIVDKEGIKDVNGVDILTGAKGNKTYDDLVKALMDLKKGS